MSEVNLKEAPPVPEMSPEEIERALELLKNPKNCMNEETALMVRFLYRSIVKHFGSITDMDLRIARIEDARVVYKFNM